MNDDCIKIIVLLQIILAPGEETKIPKRYVENLLKPFLDNGYLKVLESNENEEYYVLEVVEKYKKKIINVIIPIFVRKSISSKISYGEEIPYDLITNLIFEIGSKGTKFKDNEDDEIHIEFDENSNPELEILMFKINRSIRLSKTQFNQISRASEEARNISGEARKISMNVLSEVDSVKKIKGQIYSEFIAILGIFSALIFGLFGGFEAVKGILSLFKSPNNFGIISMYCGLTVLMIVTITFALIQFIGKLIGKNIKSCCHEDSCDCVPQNKYKIYTICIYMSVAMILLGAGFNGTATFIKVACPLIILIIILSALFYLRKFRSKKN